MGEYTPDPTGDLVTFRKLEFFKGYKMNTFEGKPAVPFSLADSEGKTHSLEDYKGRWLLMVFHRHLG